MLGLFLRPDAVDLISGMDIDEQVRKHALEVIEKGYTVVPRAIPDAKCRALIERFERFERNNAEILSPHKLENGRFPRIVNLHNVLGDLVDLFVENSVWLQVQDLLFGAPTVLYTSLFYQVGSQQSVHRDTPVFSTRPEYLYFGTTVYLEPADDENGCLEVIEGGHKMPELEREAIALARFRSLDEVPATDNDLWVDYQNGVAAQAKSLGLVTKRLHVQAGDSLIWHPQLPHGGSPINDPGRTRYSLVMHNTPVDMAVYHQDVFFNPGKVVSGKAPWAYREVKGRQIADQGGSINFGHAKAYAASDFNLS
jgi:phytanoyl-CoA hydroxylase